MKRVPGKTARHLLGSSYSALCLPSLAPSIFWHAFLLTFALVCMHDRFDATQLHFLANSDDWIRNRRLFFPALSNLPRNIAPMASWFSVLGGSTDLNTLQPPVDASQTPISNFRMTRAMGHWMSSEKEYIEGDDALRCGQILANICTEDSKSRRIANIGPKQCLPPNVPRRLAVHFIYLGICLGSSAECRPRSVTRLIFSPTVCVSHRCSGLENIYVI
jgi:hypothetical protein